MSAPTIGITTWTVYRERQGTGDRCQLLAEAYSRAVLAAGGLPLLIPSSSGGEAARGAAERLDGILLSGGPDVDPLHWGDEPRPGMGEVDPVRDEVEIELTRYARDRDVPLLGICRGIQVLNVALGGSVIQDLSAGEGRLLHEVRACRAGPGHSVTVLEGTRLAGILGPGRHRVTSSHHQAVGEVAPALVVSARAPDGVVEAVEHPGCGFLLGVQWHPERTAGRSELSRALFAAFVQACRR